MKPIYPSAPVMLPLGNVSNFTRPERSPRVCHPPSICFFILVWYLLPPGCSCSELESQPCYTPSPTCSGGTTLPHYHQSCGILSSACLRPIPGLPWPLPCLQTSHRSPGSCCNNPTWSPPDRACPFPSSRLINWPVWNTCAELCADHKC